MRLGIVIANQMAWAGPDAILRLAQPEEIAAGLAAYRAAGCTELILDLQRNDSLDGRLATLEQLTPLVR